MKLTKEFVNSCRRFCVTSFAKPLTRWTQMKKNADCASSRMKKLPKDQEDNK